MSLKKPEWLKVKYQEGVNFSQVDSLLNRFSLNTVCEEANCPNKSECYNKKTATFMILGKFCTRNCTFCNVTKTTPMSVDPMEPARLAQAVKVLNLKHVVITSVTRDDLDDGGAGQFAEVINKIREINNDLVIEVLIPDFQGNVEALNKVIRAKPDIINHNIETVARLYPEVRPMAEYRRSLELLNNVNQINKNIMTKSGIMVGLGEVEDEVLEVLKDLRKNQCDLLTIGQYLAPSKKHYSVKAYIHPDIFDFYRVEAYKLGFKSVFSSPLVRSSYLAEQMVEEVI